LENWKFLINRLMVFIGMIGSFIGATLGYTDKLINILSFKVVQFFILLEVAGLLIVFIFFMLILIDYIKDIKRGRKDESF